MSNPVSNSLSTQLRKYRGEQSYARFAAKLGISKSLAHKLENSGEGATLNTVYKIACSLQISVEELLGSEEVRKRRGRRG